MAIVRKDFLGNQQNWILTGFSYDKSDIEKNREATEAIKTVIANYSNSDGYSYFRNQVGAIITSLDSNISQSESKSSPQTMVQNNKTYGFAYKGKIYLNPEIMNSEVPLYEYTTHLWDNYTQKTNPDLWSKGKEIFKKNCIICQKRKVIQEKKSDWSTIARVQFPLEVLQSDNSNILTK